jgi:regulator of protease activity HflC (stomatin/prohibitin superfamily)
MPFRPSSNPADWQTGVYNRQEFDRDIAQRRVHLWLSFLVATLPAGLVLFALLQYERTSRLFTSWNAWILTLLGILPLAMLFDFLIVRAAVRIAAQFLREFYRPPEEINPARIIWFRLYGMSDVTKVDEWRQFPYILVREGKLFDEKGDHQAWMAQNLGGPLRLIIFDGNALYLERGGRFSRVVGPGRTTAFLDWFETIKEIVDTRPQMREDALLPCWTRDGIRVNVTARVECSLGNPAGEQRRLLYPFDPVAVRNAVERTSVRMPDGKTLSEMKGLDLVWGQVTGVIPDYIGQFKLDELLLPERGASPILSAEATQHLRDALNRLTQPFGYHVTNVQITRIELPAAIEEQRERNWQAERQSLANLMHAQAEAARIRAIEQARAEAQRDLILAIAEGLNRDPTRRFAEPLLLALTSTITTSLANPLVPPLLTPETLRSLEQLKALLEGQHET